MEQSNLYLNFGKDLYRLTTEKIDTSASSDINPDRIISGSSVSVVSQSVGNLASGKTKFDNTENGYILGLDEGVAKLYIGNSTYYFNWTGTGLDMVGNISGRASSTLASAIDASGHFADNAISTATATIITPFTFGVSGALQIGTYVNGVSGDLKISPAGILARDINGATSFFLNGLTGVISGNALVVGTNVGLGTAQDSAGVTTIIGNVVTTGFVNALNVNAASISASISITSPTITGGTIRTAASGARVEISASNNRLDIYNSTPTNIGWFGGAGANGNFMYINQPDTNEDYPPIYVTSAQDSNVINFICTNSGTANRPAFRFQSDNDSSEAMYITNSSNTMPTLGLSQSGTGFIIGTNVAGCYLDKAGTWTDASSRTLKENFENVSVLDKLKTLDILQYNYKVDAIPKTENKIIVEKKKEDDIKGGGIYKLQESKTPKKHLTPMAEDFNAIFGLGNGDGISPADLAGVALQAVKELNQKVELLEQKLKDK
jgi:hypothetical protein